MIDLTETTNVYRPMPKELFLKYFNDHSPLKKRFVDEIRSIIWINTISSETTNTPKGKHVTEIAVVEIVLNRQAISTNIIEIINREIDQYAVFIVRFEEWGQIWCCDHQSLNPQTGLFNCQNYYQTSWMIADELTLKIDGLNLDQVYENFLIQIVGKPLPTRVDRAEKHANDELRPVEKSAKKEQLEKLEAVIKDLESQMGKEMRFGKQVKLATDLKTAKEEIQKIKRSLTTHIEIVEVPQETEAKNQPYFPNAYFKMQDTRRTQYNYSLI